MSPIEKMSIEVYNKLIDCEVFRHSGKGGVSRKFVQRSRSMAVVAELVGGSHVRQYTVAVERVRMGDRWLSRSGNLVKPDRPEPFIE